MIVLAFILLKTFSEFSNIGAIFHGLRSSVNKVVGVLIFFFFNKAAF